MSEIRFKSLLDQYDWHSRFLAYHSQMHTNKSYFVPQASVVLFFHVILVDW